MYTRDLILVKLLFPEIKLNEKKERQEKELIDSEIKNFCFYIICTDYLWVHTLHLYCIIPIHRETIQGKHE